MGLSIKKLIQKCQNFVFFYLGKSNKVDELLVVGDKVKAFSFTAILFIDELTLFASPAT